MLIKFSKQAEQIINQMENKEEIRKSLTDLAIQRAIIISGGDVIKYLIKKELVTSLGLEEVKDGS